MASDQPIVNSADGLLVSAGKTNHRTLGWLTAESSQRPAWIPQGQRLCFGGSGGQCRAGEQIQHSGYQVLPMTKHRDKYTLI